MFDSHHTKQHNIIISALVRQRNTFLIIQKICINWKKCIYKVKSKEI
jgi:hypothetical protein